MADKTSGILNLDKPAGWTSHDVVAKVRRISGVRRIGHTGTLDPMATGVLILCLGKATRLVEYLMGQPKIYLAQATLGAATDTYDAEGDVMARFPVPDLAPAALEQALQAFRGPIKQRPPAYSALKRGGEPLYKKARRGETIEIEPRPVTIYQLDLLAFDGQRLELKVVCSAGAYIRSLIHDLGQALGCGAYLSSLRRIAAGHFSIDEAVTLEQLERGWIDYLQPLETALAHLERVTLAEPAAAGLLHGQAVAGPAPASPEPAAAYDPAGRLLAVVRYDWQRQAWRPLKVLAGDS